MKKTLRICLAICMAFIGTTICQRATAQALIPSNNPDTTLTSVVVGVSELNCAIYEGGAKLFGAAWRDGSGACHFVVRDNSQYVSPTPQQLVPPMFYDIICPDIVIGAPYSGSTEYFVGIVYDLVNGGMQTDIYMDVYKIEYQGGVPTITGQNPQIQIATNIGMHVSVPHIDIINKQDPTPPTFYSDKFVITWATSSGMNPTIEACAGSLIDLYTNGNTGTNITYASTTINDVANVTAGYESDIAGIERVITGNNKDIAYIVFTDNSGLPYVSKWNITNNAVTWDNTPKDATVAFTPRIDALDPYTQSGNGEEYYVTYAYDAGSGLRQVKSYTPINGLKTNTITASNNPISTTNTWYPNVTCSPDLGYSVVFYSQGSGDIILEPMDWNNTYANNCSCTSGGNPTEDYFQVNATATTPLYLSSSANAWKYNSGSGKLEPHIALVAWPDYANNLLPTINYKRFTTLTTNPFKEPNSVTSIANETSLSISPNPAYDKLDIEGIANGTNYTITDITGRNVQSGKIASAHIHINTLASGMYILNTGDQKVKFVKE